MTIRPVRIAGVAAVLMFLFHLSRKVGATLGNPEPPGLLVAIGVLSLLFSIRALLSESTMGSEANGQKDFLWGLTIGGWATLVIRLISQLSGQQPS